MENRTRVPRKTPERVQTTDMILEQIRQRAYELYEARGKEDGSDLDDWLKAELEVKNGARVVTA